MCAADKTSSITVSVRNVEIWSHKLLQLYPRILNYLLKKFTTDQAFAVFEAAIYDAYSGHLVAIEDRR